MLHCRSNGSFSCSWRDSWHLITSFAADNPRILIYTRNQIGQGLYVHDNIAQATAAIQKAAAAQHIDTDVSDNPTVFTSANLKRYKALIFNNTNNEILDTEDQKAAFQRYIRQAADSWAFIPLTARCASGRGSGRWWAANSAAIPKCRLSRSR